MEAVSEIKQKLLINNCQVVMLDKDLRVVDSCDSLFALQKGESINYNKDLVDVVLLQKNGSFIKDDFVFDLQDMDSNSRCLKIFRLSSAPGEIVMRKFQRELLQKCLGSNMFLGSESPVGISVSLLKLYLQRLLSEDSSEENEYIPFKLEHIIESIFLFFSSMVSSNHVALDCNATFSSSFIIGNRLGLLNQVISILYRVMSCSKNSSVQVLFNYNSETSLMTVRIKGGQIMEMNNVINGWDINGWQLIGLSLEHSMGCDVVGYENIASDKLRLTPAEFPYLFNITGGDEMLVEDLLHTILDQVHYDLELLQEAVKQQDWEDLERLTHKLKPNFTSIERDDLAEMLQQMEQEAISRNEEKFEETLKSFLPIAIKSVEKLKNYQL